MPAYSHSKLETYEQCPKKYEFRYVKNIKTEEEGVEAFMGSRVHEALERLYQLARDGHVLGEEELIRGFHASWDKAWHAGVKIVREELTADDYRRVGEKCLREYYRRYHPFDQATVIDIERKVSFALDPEKRRHIQGYVDRIDKVADGVYEIHDYKTSGRLPAQEKLDHDRQLALYEIAIRESLPNVREVGLIWHFLKFNEEMRSRRDPNELAALRRSLNEVIDEIEAAERSGEFAPRESALCAWCDYKPVCPLFCHQFITAHPEQEPPPHLALEAAELVRKLGELDGRIRHLTAQAAELKEEKEELEAQVVRAARALNVSRLFGGEWQVTVTVKNDHAWPSSTKQKAEHDELERILRASGDWDKLSSTYSKPKLRDWLETAPADIRAQVERLAPKQDITHVRLTRAKPAPLEVSPAELPADQRSSPQGNA